MLKSELGVDGIVLDDEVLGRLDGFAELLMEWNAVHNLTGAKNRMEIDRNIVDSLYPLSFIKKPESLLDVGTGAGFPGLALGIALPDAEVVLAEPLKKRMAFLKYAAMDLGLSNVHVEAKRVEMLEHTPFDLITSRAVTNTRVLLKLTEKVSDNDTAYLFYKGERVFDEIDEVAQNLNYKVIEKDRRNYLYITPPVS